MLKGTLKIETKSVPRPMGSRGLRRRYSQMKRPPFAGSGTLAPGVSWSVGPGEALVAGDAFFSSRVTVSLLKNAVSFRTAHLFSASWMYCLWFPCVQLSFLRCVLDTPAMKCLCVIALAMGDVSCYFDFDFAHYAQHRNLYIFYLEFHCMVPESESSFAVFEPPPSLYGN